MDPLLGKGPTMTPIITHYWPTQLGAVLVRHRIPSPAADRQQAAKLQTSKSLSASATAGQSQALSSRWVFWGCHCAGDSDTALVSSFTNVQVVMGSLCQVLPLTY